MIRFEPGARLPAAGAVPRSGHRGRPQHAATVIALDRSDRAAENRTWLAARGIVALGLTGAPGAGTTALLERTASEVGDELGLTIVDVAPGEGEAEIIGQRLRAQAVRPGSLVMIVIAGGLADAARDFGEHAKIVVLPATGGEDVPEAHPRLFEAARLILLDTSDRRPGSAFGANPVVANARAVNPAIEVRYVAVRAPGGLAPWYGWLRRELSLAGARP